MTVIRFRCEHRTRAEAAVAGSSPRFPARSLTRPEEACSGVSEQRPSSTSTAPPSSGSRATRALEGARIVLVEDDDDARDLVSIIFTSAGAVVESAASASAGFSAVYASRAQLLVSDIGMPYEDGYSLMRRIRELQCSEGGDIPAIALSAFTRPEDRMLALRAGFTIHIAKPVHPTALVLAAATLIGLVGQRERGAS